MGVDAVFRRDRAIVLAALLGVTALAWAHLYDMAFQAGLHAHHASPLGVAWRAKDLLLAFLMWNVMMAGMMIPTASPMILAFATTNRRFCEQQGPFVPTAFFVLGYLLAWAGYSAVATFAQWALHSASLLTPAAVRTTPLVGGFLLITAGAFQWSALKYNCLTQCRTPLSFLMTEWREGRRGALRMGLKHGAYCVGCCWAIMALMLVAGAMNLLWTALLAAYMLLEKVAPGGQQLGRAAGIAFAAAGAWMVLGSLA